jgi:phospholipid/cholesterol/gamma-HCH transport system substrate-binding protein
LPIHTYFGYFASGGPSGLGVAVGNNSPLPLNPFLSKWVDPSKILDSDPRLAPGGEGPKPVAPEIPPAVTVYTGLPGDPVGPPMPQPPAAPSVSGILLPADEPQQ